MDRHPWDRRGRTIDFIRNVRATRQTVWDTLTTPSKIMRWMRMSEVTLPLQVGADVEFVLRTTGRLHGEDRGVIRARVKAVETPVLLALEYQLPASGVWTDLSFQVQQSFALFGQDHGHECDVWLVHSGFPSEGVGLFEHDGHLRHWRQQLGEMAALIEDRPGKPTPYSLAGLQFVGGAYGVGILVANAVSGSPADRAGIAPGDVIVAIDGHRVYALDDFHDWIDERMPGESGVFTLQDRTVEVTVESVEDARQRFLISQGEKWVSVR